MISSTWHGIACHKLFIYGNLLIERQLFSSSFSSWRCLPKRRSFAWVFRILPAAFDERTSIITPTAMKVRALVFIFIATCCCCFYDYLILIVIVIVLLIQLWIEFFYEKTVSVSVRIWIWSDLLLICKRWVSLYIRDAWWTFLSLALPIIYIFTCRFLPKTSFPYRLILKRGGIGKWKLHDGSMHDWLVEVQYSN